jgi:iron(III) transport system substrate-binding protein
MKAWLQDMQELEPKSYSSNTPMIQALAAGEIDIALTNHYYVLRLLHGDAKVDEDFIQSDAPISTYHFENGDVGNVALVTGAGILKTSNVSDKAQAFLEFLLSKQAQSFAANQVHEYPVTTDVELPSYMMDPEAAHQLSPDYDYKELENLEQTLDIMRELGLL